MFLADAVGASHPESLYVLQHLRSHVERFTSDGHVRDELKERFGRYRVLLVNETSLEGLHATLQQHYTRSNLVGSTRVGICTHLPEIKRAMNQNDSTVDSLASIRQKAAQFVVIN